MPRTKVAALIVAFVLTVASVIAAYFQPRPAQFASSPSFLTASWWLKPIEQNEYARPEITSMELAAIATVPGTLSQELFAVGDGGTILHTKDGGRSWRKQSSGTPDSLYGTAFSDSQNGWAVGDGGTILHTKDGGQSWTKQSSGTPDSLYGTAFSDSQNGWAVGDGGTILHTKDGGQSWTKQSSGTTPVLYGTAFSDSQNGWAVGAGGTILHTKDGGQSWLRVGQYRRYPAPFLFLALVASVISVWYASTPTRPRLAARLSELVNADAPVNDPEQDRLGSSDIVGRLSAFIRNPNTMPPVVITVQAAWGMGKSSVMKMLEHNLRSKRAAATVWFNAWHHQKEDQLLAFLLETIQKESVRSLPLGVAIRFRLNLAEIRLKEKPFKLLQIVVFFAFALLGTYFFSHGKQPFPFTLPLISQSPIQVTSELTNGIFVGVFGPAFAFAVGQLFKAFKTNPDKLLEKSRDIVGDTFKELINLPSLVGKSDVRREFAKNLSEVVEALSPQRLVIFLDDLDRCKPEQVVQILESVNFLSSAANCFIILGADYEQIETLVGLHFEPIAMAREKDIDRRSPSLIGAQNSQLRIPVKTSTFSDLKRASHPAKTSASSGENEQAFGLGFWPWVFSRGRAYQRL